MHEEAIEHNRLLNQLINTQEYHTRLLVGLLSVFKCVEFVDDEVPDQDSVLVEGRTTRKTD